MKVIIETIKENKNFILITIFSTLTIIFFATSLLFTAISDDLVYVVHEKDKKISELNSEVKRQKMISNNWYQMWLEERSTNEK